MVVITSAYPEMAMLSNLHDLLALTRVAKTSSEKRMGLSSMEQRVDLLLGRISIESTPGKGTKVAIKIPYKDGIEITSEI